MINDDSAFRNPPLLLVDLLYLDTVTHAPSDFARSRAMPRGDGGVHSKEPSLMRSTLTNIICTLL
jgi:hypothetical protein